MGRRIGLVAGMATSLLLSGCLLLRVGSVDAALAGWTPVPRMTGDSRLLHAALDRCLPDGELGRPLWDERAPDVGAFLILGDSGASSICLLAGSGPDPRVLRLMPVDGGPDHPDVLDLLHLETARPSLIAGTVPPGTRRVVIETMGGTTLEATTALERFLAWWPDADPVRSVTAFDADGDVVGTLFGTFGGEPSPGSLDPAH